MQRISSLPEWNLYETQQWDAACRRRGLRVGSLDPEIFQAVMAFRRAAELNVSKGTS